MLNHPNPFVRMTANAVFLPAAAAITLGAVGLTYAVVWTSALFSTRDLGDWSHLGRAFGDDSSNVVNLADHSEAGNNAARCVGDRIHAGSKTRRR